MIYHILYEEPVYNSSAKAWKVYNETKDKKETNTFEDREDALLHVKLEAKYPGDVIFLHEMDGTIAKKLTREDDHFRSS